MKNWKKVYLGLGSNLGNRKKHLSTAKTFLDRDPHIKIMQRSSIYRTSPLGPAQRDFLNSVFQIKTLYSPFQLLLVLKGIEKKMKRKKTVRDGPRVIDLDILLFEKKVLKTSSLTLPHPRIMQRRFVLVPFCELAPHLKLPHSKRTVFKALNALTPTDQRVKLYGKFPV